MNTVETLLLSLLRDAETPLYSAYRWLDERLAQSLTLQAFLQLIEGPVDRDVIRLWEVSSESGDRTELFGVPQGLADRYTMLTEFDPTFDPFGLSLTLGPSAPLPATETPVWKFDLGADGTFNLQAPDGIAEHILEDVVELLSDLRFERTEVKRVGGDEIAITGRASKPKV